MFQNLGILSELMKFWNLLTSTGRFQCRILIFVVPGLAFCKIKIDI